MTDTVGQGSPVREATPLTVAEAAPLFAPFARAGGVLLAVSGGPDSVAMMHLAAATLGGAVRLAVASVDHGLRDGSRASAEAAVAGAASLRLPGRVLAWDGPKPRTGLQEAARGARYALLVAEAHRIGATYLATAHTRDDQAETVLFRLIRGSGLEGLGGMRVERERDGILHLRPLLDVPKARLVAACRAEGWPFEIDPANADPRHARARLRGLMPHLEREGLDAAGLARLGRRLRDADEAILHAARHLLADAMTTTTTCRFAPFVAAPPAVRRRALGLLLTDRQRAGPPRLDRLEGAVAALSSASARGVALRRTLHGVLIDFDGQDRLTLGPEPPRRAARS